MRHVLAIDQGTTGTTCLVVRADGSIAGRAYREITQHYPQPGWVEHDADEIWQMTLESAADALASAPDCRPVAIGVTNQRETVVVWDTTDGRCWTANYDPYLMRWKAIPSPRAK